MRTIGLIGGMSWESSADYYRLINTMTAQRLGGHHNADSVMVTVDFAEIEALQRAGDWAGAGRRLARAALTLERAGADLIALCTNTMHRVAEDIDDAITVPFVHIVDVTAEAVRASQVDTVALLGTRFTMEMDFYAAHMRGLGIEVIVPDAHGRGIVHDIIYDELTKGVVREESRQRYRDITSTLVEQGARGVILGCTEIGMLVGSDDTSVPVFDSTQLHAERLVDLSLS